MKILKRDRDRILKSLQDLERNSPPVGKATTLENRKVLRGEVIHQLRAGNLVLISRNTLRGVISIMEDQARGK